MRKAWIIARQEYFFNLRRPGFIIITLLVPALGALALLIGTFFGGQASSFLQRQLASEPKDLGVVDRSGLFTPLLPAYRERFRPFSEEAAGRAAVKAKELSALLVIPENYLATGQVLVVTRGTGFSAAVMEDSASARAFFVDHLVREGLSEVLRRRLADPITPIVVGLEGEEAPRGGELSTFLSIMVPYFLGILLVMTIFVSSGYLLRGVAEEKTSRVIEVLLSSVTARELLAGKVLGLGALGLTQVLVWMASAFGLSGSARSLLGVAMPVLARQEVFILGLVYYVLGFLVYAVLMAAVGSLGTTMQESQQLAGIVSMMAAIPLMLAGFMFSNPNMFLVRAFSWFPLTAPTMMMLRLPMAEVPTVDVAGSLLVLVLSIPAVLWAGAKVFRMGLLMYGKRPGLRQVWRALREA